MRTLLSCRYMPRWRSAPGTLEGAQDGSGLPLYIRVQHHAFERESTLIDTQHREFTKLWVLLCSQCMP